MKNSKYFSHDIDARNDPKIIAMRSVHGKIGGCFFWDLIEHLASLDGYKIKKDKYTFSVLSKILDESIEKTTELINDFINEFDLLVEDNEFIFSKSLLERLELRDEKTLRNSEGGKKAMERRYANSNTTTNLEKQNENTLTNLDDNSNIVITNLDDNSNLLITTKLKETKLKETKLKEKEKEIYKEKYTEHLEMNENEFGEFCDKELNLSSLDKSEQQKFIRHYTDPIKNYEFRYLSEPKFKLNSRIATWIDNKNKFNPVKLGKNGVHDDNYIYDPMTSIIY